MRFGAITKREFIEEEAMRLDQWFAELRFRRYCADLAQRLKKEARKARENPKETTNGAR